MNQLAGVLSDLGLVSWPDKGMWGRIEKLRLAGKSELERLKIEEEKASNTDLTELHKRWNENADSGPSDMTSGEGPIRNHGLFSKAERALQMAGWTTRAAARLGNLQACRRGRSHPIADGSQ
jgi:hypothetical protein